MLRVSLSLRREIELAARESRRSLSGEVAYRLVQSFDRENKSRRRRRKSVTAVRPASAVLHP